jgi:opacity protein-like surface antigen
MARMAWQAARLATALLAAAVLGFAGSAAAQEFDGGYIGFYGATTEGDSLEGGAFGGYRFQVTDSAYLGAEVDILLPSGATDYLAAGLGSLSYEILPDTLIYGHAGFAFDSADSEFWVAGAGIDYAVTDGVSLRLGGDRYDDLNGPASEWVAKAGVALSF